MLILESFQAGLSWHTILKKRENFRHAFDNFDVHNVAAYNAEKVTELMADVGIIRNRLKILAAIHNAKIFIQLQHEGGSFAHYIWGFTEHKIIDNHPQQLSDIPATTPISDAMAKDMKKRGIQFMGSTIAYAMMQSIGMVNDHIAICHTRHSECRSKKKTSGLESV